MDRRHALAALAAAVVTPALAQQTGQPHAPADAGAGTSPGGGLYAGSGGTQAATSMGQAEQQWMQQTMAAGSAALTTSQIALEKAENPEVKLFARFEADEQTGMADVLHSMATPNPAAAAAAGTAAPSSASMDMVQKLQSAKAGVDFDRDYVRGQIQGHQELLQAQETYLKSGARNREAANVAKLARSRIQEHLENLQDLEKDLGRG